MAAPSRFSTEPRAEFAREVVENGVQLTEKEQEIFTLLLEVLRERELDTTLRVAGGWVRDKLLSKNSHDIDIALDNMMGLEFAEHVNAYLEGHHMPTHHIGAIKANPEQSKHLETATMLLAGEWIDFVNLRSEAYADTTSRIPTVSIGTPKEDALRRDLTINSLFYNINDGRIEDFTEQGLADIERGVIRTPLPARQTFLDDPLRILRAIRFASRFTYEVSNDIKDAVRDEEVRAALASKVSRERFGKELCGMLTGPRPVLSLAYLFHYGIADIVLEIPDSAVDERQVEDSLSQYDAVRRQLVDHICELNPVRCARLMSAYLTHDFGRDQVDMHDDDLAVAGVYLAAVTLPWMFLQVPIKKRKYRSAPAEIIKTSLKLSSRLGGMVDALQQQALLFASLFPELDNGSLTRLALGNTLRSPGVGHMWPLALSLAAIATQPDTVPLPDLDESLGWDIPPPIALTQCQEIARLVHEWGLEDVWNMRPLVTGKEIMDRKGVRGPLIGQYLEIVIDFQLENPGVDADGVRRWLDGFTLS